MPLKHYLAGGLAILGGLLMLTSGYVSRGFLYTALQITEPRLSDYLSGAVLSVAVLAVAFLELVIALGGLTVIVGGLVVITHHTTAGRTLIYLGGAAGFLGLLISFGYSVYKLGGLDPVLSYLPYWVGIAFAVTGRRLAKGA